MAHTRSEYTSTHDFEGDDVEEQAEVVREQLDGIASDCQEQLAE